MRKGGATSTAIGSEPRSGRRVAPQGLGGRIVTCSAMGALARGASLPVNLATWESGSARCISWGCASGY